MVGSVPRRTHPREKICIIAWVAEWKLLLPLETPKNRFHFAQQRRTGTGAGMPGKCETRILVGISESGSGGRKYWAKSFGEKILFSSEIRSTCEVSREIMEKNKRSFCRYPLRNCHPYRMSHIHCSNPLEYSNVD